jgi:hypothetical protein
MKAKQIADIFTSGITVPGAYPCKTGFSTAG